MAWGHVADLYSSNVSGAVLYLTQFKYQMNSRSYHWYKVDLLRQHGDILIEGFVIAAHEFGAFITRVIER